MDITTFCADLPNLIVTQGSTPWDILSKLEVAIYDTQRELDDDYVITDGIAIHKTAHVDASATIHAPVIIGRDCFVGPHVLMRGGVYIGDDVSIGPSCEVKHAYIGNHSALAHFNFVGDSIIGSNVNFEAGAITANHYNERVDKTIFSKVNDTSINTHVEKFGALIGDGTKVGANAVTSPGTILPAGSIVARLELIDQAGK